MSKWFRRAALSAVTIYLLVLAALWLGQERLLFRPVVLPPTHRFQADPDVHETWFDVPGARLNALQLKLPAPDGVVFFLHGNAGSLERWFTQLELYRSMNLDLVMIDYRGYGKSSGRIGSEAQLVDDVRRVWAAVAPAYAGKRRVFYGRSLGTGPAAQLAAEVQPELTVLVSPYESMQVLAEELYPWVPGVLLRYPLRTDLALPKIHRPVLLLHGDRDTLIAVDHSRRLKQANPGVTLVEVAGAGHSDIHRDPAYLEALRRALPLQSPASTCSAGPCAGTDRGPHLVPKILSPASPSPGMM